MSWIRATCRTKIQFRIPLVTFSARTKKHHITCIRCGISVCTEWVFGDLDHGPQQKRTCPIGFRIRKGHKQTRTSAEADARLSAGPKRGAVETTASYAASAGGSSFFASSICFSSSARFLALMSSRFWRLTSSCFSAPRSSMNAFSAPSPCWKPVRTMRR